MTDPQQREGPSVKFTDGDDGALVCAHGRPVFEQRNPHHWWGECAGCWPLTFRMRAWQHLRDFLDGTPEQLRSANARLTAELAEAREEVTRLKSGLLFFIVDECIETIAGVNVVDACGADAGDPALVTDEQVVAKALARIDAARGEP